MINKADVERVKFRYKETDIYPDNVIVKLCDYYLEQNKEKKIKKLNSYNLVSCTQCSDKLNEIIDVINEMREGK